MHDTKFVQRCTAFLAGMKGVWWMPRFQEAMKDVVWLRYARGRCQTIVISRDFRMRKLTCLRQVPLYEGAYPVKWNITVAGGKESNTGIFFLNGRFASCSGVILNVARKHHYVQEEDSCDFLSSGERNGNSPNHSCLHGWGCRAAVSFSWEELQNGVITERVGKRDSKG